MEDGDFNSLIEGLGSGSGSLLVTQQNHYVVSNTYISAEQPFPTPSPSPSIILRSPVAAVPPPSPQPPARSPAPSPARPTTPQSTLTQYSSIAPNSNQIVQLFSGPGQANSLVGRTTQILQAAASAQAAQLKGKQPQQILPKPLAQGASAKQAVARMAPNISQQSGPLLINQSQPQNQALLLNQVLTSSGPVLMQPASTSGTVHLMLRPPTPTLQAGPGPQQGKMVIGSPVPQQQTVLIQQNRQQIMRIMTPQGPMQVQLQQIQTPNGPQFIAIPTSQTLAFPHNSVLVPAPAHMTQQVQQQTRVITSVDHAKKKQTTKKPKPIKARSDSSTSPPSSREDLSPPHVSPKVAVLSSPMCSPPPPPQQKPMTSTLRQIRPTAFARKQADDMGKDGRGEEGGKQPPAVVDNLTATINSVAENTKSPLQDSVVDDVLSGTQNLNLNKRPNLTIFQKTRTELVPTVVEEEERRKPPPAKKTPTKKKGKKDDGRLDLWDIMKSAGIGDEECDETPPEVVQGETIEFAGADSELLAQIQGSLRLAMGEDGRPLLIDSSGVVIADQAASGSQLPDETPVITLKPQGTQTPSAETPVITLSQSSRSAGGDSPMMTLTGQGGQGSNAEGPVITMTAQALATAQSQLTQLLQDHGAVTPADQQLLAQIFTANPNQGLSGINLSGQGGGESSVVVNSRGTETEPASISNVHQQQHLESPQVNTRLESAHEQFVSAPPPGLPPLGPDSLVITNNNGVPTLVASPELLNYLQTHQGIIQFQHDPVTKTIQPSLIIPHPSPQQQQQRQTVFVSGSQSPRSDARLSPRSAPAKTQESANGNGNKGVCSATSLANIVRNQQVASGVKMSMARIIQENPSLLQIARETSNLITYKESCPNLREADLAEIEKKIQANRVLLDQCFHMELENLQNPAEIAIVKGFQGTPSASSPNTEFQNKFLESIGMTTPPTAKMSVSVGTGTTPPLSQPTLVIAQPQQPQTVIMQQPQPVVQQQQQPAPPPANKRNRKKKAAEKVPEPAATPQNVPTAQPPPLPPPPGNLTFNIKQLTPEQNERLNIALSQRGITANQVANCEMTDVEKQIIEEEIKRVTGGALGNLTVKFFTPQSSHHQPAHHQPEENKVNAATMARFYSEDELDCGQQQSAMVVNNPNLNQLLDTPVGTQIVSLSNHMHHTGNQIVTMASPPPGSVIVGSNGNVVAFVQQAVQFTPQKQQMLKAIQAQIQTLQSKINKTPSDHVTLQKLAMEQQKVLASAKIVSTSNHPNSNFQIVSQPAGLPRMFQQACVGPPKPATTSVSCGTSTADIGVVGPSVQKPPPGAKGPMLLVADQQYGPLYVSPNASGKVLKCEKGTSPIQIQMGTQTADYCVSKMSSTGTMTSPNTGKPQAVVAPAVHLHQQQPVVPPPPNTTWVKQQRRCPSPALTVSRTALIEKQVAADQQGAVCPDTHTPYLSKVDAVKRLMRYHVMDEKGLCEQDLRAADDMFETTSQHLLDKFKVMKDKYKYLLLMESMREVSTAERIMVDRNFIIEERMELEELRERERREQDEFEKAPTQPPVIDINNTIKTEIKEEVLEPPKLDLSEDDILSPGSHTNDEKSSSSCLPDISAQVQSAIDSILNLQKSDDTDDDRRKRKRPRTGTSSGGGKRSRRRDGEDEDGNTSDQDPALDEAIRSILAS